MSRPRLIVLNVIVLFFNPDVAIALAFENRFCPPYFFLFPFSFFSIFFSFLCLFLSPPPLRPVLCLVGRAVPGLCCPPAAARGRPGYRHTDGARAAPLPAAQPRRPPRVWIKTTVALPPPAASPRGDVSWWLCPAQWHDDPVRLCVSAGLASVPLHPAGAGGAVPPPCPPPAPEGSPSTAETLGSFPAHC